MISYYCGDKNAVVIKKTLNGSWQNHLVVYFDPANTDYAKFKADILENKAELQDAEGNTMTAEDAQAFVATLP